MEQHMGDKLFPQFYGAVKALMKCCEREKGKEIPPIARSEVYNETWMLRLTLALLHDYEGDFKIENNNKQTILKSIQNAVRKRWISEGGLHPAFKNEGPTWADAVIGDIDLGTKMKREIIVKALDKESTGIIVIEAKIGSKLSKGITHEKQNYNQAARNISCLAKLVLDKKLKIEQEHDLIDKCRLVVFGPNEKTKKWDGIKDACDIITGVKDVVSKQSRELNATKRELTKEIMEDTVGTISDHSTAIAWEDIIDATQCRVLKWFYRQARNEALKTMNRQ